jgi:anti-sigma B factor antagonist
MENAPMIRESRQFTSDTPQLAELRRFVSDCVHRAWPSAASDLFAELALATQEAAANVIKHAYQREPGRPIYADMEIDDQRLALTLTHEGRDFDPAAVPPPSFDGSRTGGFGVHLIRAVMDEVYYLHTDARRGIRMVKRRAARAEGENKMQMLVEKFDDVAVVAPGAETLDASNADDFRRDMEPVLRDTRKLVLDMNKVTFVDSPGCGAILSCLKHLTEAGGDLKLCRVTRPARLVFDLIRLHRICEIVDTKEQALAAFKASRGA